MINAANIVAKLMEHDAFSKWLGISVLEISPGMAKLAMTVREDMTNGFKIAHGAISYALADSALAFASNGHGKKCVSIETSISHTEAAYVGDTLTAVAKELSCKEKIAIYAIEVKNQNNKTVALFKGSVYRRNAPWE